MLSELYEIMQMSQAYAAFAERHNICSPSILTVAEDETAELLCERLAPRISGKTVVETGGPDRTSVFGHASVAKRVYCIKANPMWASTWRRRSCSRRSRRT
jgi:hypothetical protein